MSCTQRAGVHDHKVDWRRPRGILAVRHARTQIIRLQGFNFAMGYLSTGDLGQIDGGGRDQCPQKAR